MTWQLVAGALATPFMNTTIPLRSVLLTLGALLLLLVLWKLAFVIATLVVPVLFVWLLLSWNHPQRAKAIFGPSASKGLVRAGLGGAMIACVLFASATASSRSGAGTSAPRLAQGNGADGEDGSAPNTAPAVNAAAAKLRTRKAEERIRVAENRVRLAEIAERKAKRAQDRLDQKQKEDDQRREALAKEQTKREQEGRKASRLANRQKARSARESNTSDAKPKGRVGDVSVQNLDGIGPREVGTVDDVQYAIVNVERTRQIGSQNSDGIYVVLRVVAVNTDKKTHDINPQVLSLFDDRDREFQVSSLGYSALLLSGEQSVNISTQVQPDTPKGFSVVYDVPENAQGFRLKIPASLLGLGRTAIIKAP